MKVLYVTGKSADYVQDLTYSGLVKVLGLKNVIDYPWNQKFHIPYKKYPRNLGYTKFSLVPSLLNRSYKDVDMVIVGASKVDCFQSYLEIMDDIPSNIPTVFIDGGDQPGIGDDIGKAYHAPELYEKVINKRAFDYIFKREYPIDADYGDNVFPFPISFNLDRAPKVSEDYKYDVSFWGVESWPIRTQALEILEDKFDCRSNGTVRNQVFSKYKRKGTFYLEELSRCKIVLNFRGGGWDTMRYWEIPAVQTLQLSQKPQIKIPDNFEHEKSIIFCQDDLSDLTHLCEYYLKNETQREKIAVAGYNHLKEFHTDVARAKYLLQKVTDTWNK